ncbi:hypothetical protein D3C72_1383410 [compost metagenome]
MMAAGGRPLRISGKPRDARDDTSVKSQRIAMPNPNPSASPCTCATEMSEVERSKRFSSMRRLTSACRVSASRPARSRPAQKTSPAARRRNTRAVGRSTSLRSAATIASNMGADTSFPASGRLRTKVRTPPARSISTGGENDAGAIWPPKVQWCILRIPCIQGMQRSGRSQCLHREPKGRR